jgi:cytoskeletal protein CcmA (bactofilin family)
MPSGPSKPAFPVAPARPGAAGLGHAGQPAAQDNGRKLIVGSGISLTGEISACDHLVVEGRIEAKLKDCRSIDVAAGGVYKGSAEVDIADIGGRFDGDLTVRGRIRLRGTGVVSGKLRYGEMEVECGGKIVGAMEPLDKVVTTIGEAKDGKAEEMAQPIRRQGIS